MTNKNFKIFLNQPPADLQKRLEEKREALRQFNFKAAGGKLTNVKEARRLRQDIARILTLQHGKNS